METFESCAELLNKDRLDLGVLLEKNLLSESVLCTYFYLILSTLDKHNAPYSQYKTLYAYCDFALQKKIESKRDGFRLFKSWENREYFDLVRSELEPAEAQRYLSDYFKFYKLREELSTFLNSISSECTWIQSDECWMKVITAAMLLFFYKPINIRGYNPITIKGTQYLLKSMKLVVREKIDGKYVFSKKEGVLQVYCFMRDQNNEEIGMPFNFDKNSFCKQIFNINSVASLQKHKQSVWGKLIDVIKDIQPQTVSTILN